MLRSALALLSALASFAPAIAAPTADQWAVQHPTSRLGFVARWEGEPFEGTFTRWTANMRFDPDRLDQSRFEVTIDMASADTRSAERDHELLKPAWFAARRFPRAQFATSEFRPSGADRYVALGTLSIKDSTQPIELPFTWRQAGDEATLEGKVLIDRTRWNVGEGEWADDDVIQHEVRVIVDLELVRAAP